MLILIVILSRNSNYFALILIQKNLKNWFMKNEKRKQKKTVFPIWKETILNFFKLATIGWFC